MLSACFGGRKFPLSAGAAAKTLANGLWSDHMPGLVPTHRSLPPPPPRPLPQLMKAAPFVARLRRFRSVVPVLTSAAKQEPDEEGYYLACTFEDVPNMGVKKVTINSKRLAIFRIKTDRTRIHAMSSTCVHAGTPLDSMSSSHRANAFLLLFLPPRRCGAPRSRAEITVSRDLRAITEGIGTCFQGLDERELLAPLQGECLA